MNKNFIVIIFALYLSMLGCKKEDERSNVKTSETAGNTVFFDDFSNWDDPSHPNGWEFYRVGSHNGAIEKIDGGGVKFKGRTYGGTCTIRCTPQLPKGNYAIIVELYEDMPDKSLCMLLFRNDIRLAGGKSIEVSYSDKSLLFISLDYYGANEGASIKVKSITVKEI